MDRDTFIITVYCVVVEHYQAHAASSPIRHGGFAPELSDEEVITREICGEYLKHHTDQDLFDYFRTHYRHFFPKRTDRTLFVRQAANLWQVKAALQQRLTRLSGQAADPVQAIDTLPLPVCTYTRGGRRDKCFPVEADYGHCAAKQLDDYGCQAGPADHTLRDDHAWPVAGRTAPRQQSSGRLGRGLHGNRPRRQRLP